MNTRTRKKGSVIDDAALFVHHRLTELREDKVHGVLTVRFGLKNGRVCTTAEGLDRNYIIEGPVPKIKKTDSGSGAGPED